MPIEVTKSVVLSHTAAAQNGVTASLSASLGGENISMLGWNQSEYNQELGTDQSDKIAIIVLCLVACVGIIVNSVVLAASKYASGGKTSTLVYIRSLCMGDALAGLFGIIKTLLFFLRPRWVNCFLGESLLFSAMCSSSLTLVLISIDIHIQLANPREYFRSMEKKWVVFVLVFLWNISFTIGFTPQMGWVSEDFVCEFFRFHSPHHLILVATLQFVCLIALLGLNIKIYWMMSSIASHNRLGDGLMDTYLSISALVTLVRLNVAGICAFYLPFIFYTLLHCRICTHFGLPNSQTNLHITLCWLLGKSMIMAPLHGAKNPQIFRIINRYCFCCGHSQEALALQNSCQDTTHSSQAELLGTSASSSFPSQVRNTNSSNSSLVESAHYECRRCGQVNPAFTDNEEVSASTDSKPWFTKLSGGASMPAIIVEEPAETSEIHVDMRL